MVELAPPYWGRLLMRREAPHPKAALRWSDGCLLNALVDDQVIDLKEQFSIHLTRSPLPEEWGERVQVELSQTKEVRRRLRFAFDVVGESVESLPMLSMPCPVCESEDVKAWLWPVLAYYAELHGEPLRWQLESVR